jgi:HAD superfamily hydrolase (TIGR01549 family)
MTIRAVLFDVGGPLDTEVISEEIIDRHLCEALAEAGVTVTREDLTAASERAVANFAPNTYAAMLWDLSGRDEDMTRQALARFAAGSDDRRFARGGFELRDGVPEMLMALRSDGLKLGLAANQPDTVLHELDRIGIGELFAHREVSGHHGYRKPDVRLFLRACEDLGVAPDECVMVGDRIDNDIAPAALLGMATVRIRTGRHRLQAPRSLDEVPDRECRDVPGMLASIRELCRERR